jgi:adenosine deaminase
MLARDPKLAKEVAQQGITLELCPTSNLKNGMVRDLRQFGRIVRALQNYGVRFTINTDGPEMYRTNVYKEQELLRKAHILTSEALDTCNRWAFEASFLPAAAKLTFLVTAERRRSFSISGSAQATIAVQGRTKVATRREVIPGCGVH